MNEKTIILGVDPGTIKTGFGFVESHQGTLRLLDFGVITPPKKHLLTDRYFIIFESLLTLIDKWSPHVMSVESQFVGKNVMSAMKLGMARSSAMLSAKQRGLPVYEFSPTKAKKAVTGNGLASKKQVQEMLALLLRLKKPPEPEDAADALALAITYANANQIGVEI